MIFINFIDADDVGDEQNICQTKSTNSTTV